jgi:hypothetical protein
MEAQELFDKVVQHLADQKVPAVEIVANRVECKYRDKNGNKCAFGCLIPDEVYDPGMEGIIAEGVLYEFSGPESSSMFPIKPGSLEIMQPLWKHRRLISVLQAAHDDSARDNKDGPLGYTGDLAHLLSRAAAIHALEFDQQAFLTRINRTEPGAQ